MSDLSRFPFQSLLEDLSSSDAIFSAPIFSRLKWLTSLGGRNPSGFQALAPKDRLTLFQTRAFPQIELTSTPRTKNDFAVYFNFLGRLHIRKEKLDSESSAKANSNVICGYFSLPSHTVCAIERAYARWRSVEQSIALRFGDILSRAEEIGSLDAVLENVIDAVQHVETVLWYLNDRPYAVAERFTNLVSTKRTNGVLNELRNKPLEQWNDDFKLLVALLHCLSLSGKSIRFEEFNGTTVSALSVYSRLRSLARSYLSPLNAGQLPEDPLALARLIGKAAPQFMGRHSLRYRTINGVSFCKTEKAHRWQIKEMRPRCMSVLNSLEQAWLGKLTSRSAIEIMGELSDHAIEEAAVGAKDIAEPKKLEILIEKIVSSAVTASRSDYGMSSSIRRPGALYGESTTEIANSILKLTPRDFFCCVVATPELANKYGSLLSTDVFRRVQSRMQFNRWHFIPGNLPSALVPKDRHFFYPPIMPDISEWVDLFHAAHTAGGVRYAVRAPGPDACLPPLNICGIGYRGFYDCRVVRTDGPAYSVDEMLQVTAHSRLIGVLWAKLIYFCERTPLYRDQINFGGFENGFGTILETEGWGLSDDVQADRKELQAAS